MDADTKKIIDKKIHNLTTTGNSKLDDVSMRKLKQICR